MDKKCENCGTQLSFAEVTHCSDYCLFENVQNAKSISRTPFEEWNPENYWY